MLHLNSVIVGGMLILYSPCVVAAGKPDTSKSIEPPKYENPIFSVWYITNDGTGRKGYGFFPIHLSSIGRSYPFSKDLVPTLDDVKTSTAAVSKGKISYIQVLDFPDYTPKSKIKIRPLTDKELSDLNK